MEKFAVVILAAGLGTRMHSSIPKVLHKLNGYPMLYYVINSIKLLNPDIIIIVCGTHNNEKIKKEFSNNNIIFAIQANPLGTADALLSSEEHLKEFEGNILVLNGDTPLIKSGTLKSFLEKHKKDENHLSVISFYTENPTGYGRIIRDSSKRPVMIKEEGDVNDQERQIKEVNSGVYLIKTEIFSLIKKINKNEKKGEYYLTDILKLAYKQGLRCEVYPIGNKEEFIGINTKEELLKAQRLMRLRTVMYWIHKDVGIMDEERVYIDTEVEIGEGSYLYPEVFIEGKTKIGKNCIIYPNVRIINCEIGEGVVIRENSSLESAMIEDGVSIGPFARIRPKSIIKKGAKIGNFVEVKASIIGEFTKVLHLSYIGDAEIGNNVNIGAGTITCNYDGKNKHKTIIEDKAFIGSDTQLIAPVCVKKGAFIGAGSTITKDVPEKALAISRVKQKNIEGWVKKRFSNED